MSTLFPIPFSHQLRQHLRGLRKKRGYTQAKLGQLLGVSQARIAEIEAHPGLVNLDQLLQVFSALGVTLALQDLQPDTTAAPRSTSQQRAENIDPNQKYTALAWKPAGSPSERENPKHSYVTHAHVPTPSWHSQSIRNGAQQGTSVPVQPSEHSGAAAADTTSRDSAPSTFEQLTQRNPDKEVKPASRRNFMIRPKKGSW